MSFAKLQKVAHLPACGNLRLEITWDLSANVSVGADATAKFNVSNLSLNSRMYPLTSEYINKLKEKERRGELFYRYENVYVQTAPWAAAANAVNISYWVASAKTLLVKYYLSTVQLSSFQHSIQQSRYINPSLV